VYLMLSYALRCNALLRIVHRCQNEFTINNRILHSSNLLESSESFPVANRLCTLLPE